MSESSRKKDLLDESLRLFKVWDEIWAKQRQNELNALKFDAGEQWDAYLLMARAGTQAPDGTMIGQRPCLTINKTNQPIQQIINEGRNADLGITIHAGPDSRREDALIRTGLIRNIQVKSRAQLHRLSAFSRSTTCGLGYYKIVKAYSDDPAFPFDQELRSAPIDNQGQVMADPFCQMPDFSDAEGWFIWDDMAEAAFKREYPEAALSDCNSQQLTAIAENHEGWIDGTEEGARVFRVCERYYKAYSKHVVTLMTLPDGSEVPVWDDEKDKLAQLVAAQAVPATYDNGDPITRTVQRPSSKWCKFTANEILEETDWEGSILPVVPTVGNPKNLNGKKIWEGVIQPAMDAQRLFNYTASEIATATGLATKAPYELDPEQIEGFESVWNTANSKLHPYLPRRSFHRNGQPFLPIERNQSEPPIQALSAQLVQCDAFIQSTTSTPSPALGRVDLQHRSGKAIENLQNQSRLANSNYVDNLVNLSMTKEGLIYNEMLQWVYDRPGRIVQILDGDEQPQQVMLNAPFVQDKGQPVPAQEGAQDLQHYDLAKGTYSVVVEVGQSFKTKREDNAAHLEALMKSVPTAAMVIAPYLIADLDIEKSEELSAKLKMLWPPQLQQGANGQPSPEQMQQQLQQAGKIVDELTAHVKEQAEIIKTDQIKAQREMAQTKDDNATKVRIAEINAASSLLVAEVKADLDAAKTAIQSELEQLKIATGITAKAHEQARTHAHDTGTQLRDQQHQAETQGRDQAHESEMTAAQLTAQSEMAKQKAAEGNGATS